MRATFRSDGPVEENMIPGTYYMAPSQTSLTYSESSATSYLSRRDLGSTSDRSSLSQSSLRVVITPLGL